MISREDLLRELRDGTTVVVVCRPPSPFNRPPGTRRGYSCLGCDCELEATPKGQQEIADGGIALCSPCGFAFADLAGAAGKLAAVDIGPAAARSLARGGIHPSGARLAELARKHPYRGPKS